MKKRVIAALLLFAVVIAILPGAEASGSLFFVGVNDEIPLLLPGDTAAYYANGQLYAPYTVFDAAPGKISVSYSVEQETLVLFTMSQRVVFDLKNGTMTDRSGSETSVDTIYRNGILYLPVEQTVRCFGLQVSLLSSKTGCVILRFTNGSEIYDNEKFLDRSELFVSHMLDSYGGLSSGEIQSTAPPEQQEPQTPEETGDAVIYLAFAADAVSLQTLKDLEAMEDVTGVAVQAVFFLTQEQILEERDLVRQIYAEGHTLGLTVDAPQNDLADALARANDALDEAVFCRSLLVLLPQNADAPSGYCAFYPEADNSLEAMLEQPEVGHLLVCRSDAAELLAQLMERSVSLQPLLETTRLSRDTAGERMN